MNFKIIFVSLCLSSLLLGCGGSESNSSSGGGGGGPTSPGGGSNGVNPLLLQVRYTLEGSTTKSLAGVCEILPTDPVGTVKNCTINMPELTLYYSKLEFTTSTDSRTRCTRVAFEPYYYRKSDSLTFGKDGEPDSAIDCSGSSPIDLACWGGAAPEMIEGFPFNVGNFFLTVNSLSASYVLKSNYARRAAGDKDRSSMSNIGSASNKPLASRGTSIPNGQFVRYFAGSFKDYILTCFDEWANNKYQITLTIGDDDEVDIPSQTVLDYYWDWGQ